MLHRLLLPLSQNISKPAEKQLIRALESVPGVVMVLINTQTEMIYLAYRKEDLSIEKLDAVLKASGFREEPRSHSKNLKSDSLQA